MTFDLQNTHDSQLDLPITPKAFRFRAFVKIVKAPITDSGVDYTLFSFYLKHMKSQYETWCASKITTAKIIGPIMTDRFPSANFKMVRGSTSQVYEFTHEDLPCLNPYYWIVLYNLLLKEKEKYEPVMSHLQIMLQYYI